jgi:hypothetical protein
MCINWFSCTDHSYDLDDPFENFLAEDPELPKWNNMREKAERLSATFPVIPGEEITCSNKRGRNCHMLALNSPHYIKGSGDSGEKGLDFTTEHSIEEASTLCTTNGGFCYAAHPYERFSVLEKWFLNRGIWKREDLDHSTIIGLQFHNGLRDKGFEEGREEWKRLLLAGRRIHAVAGSDSHGDMNRRRRWGIPFITITEDNLNTFAFVRTVVKAGSGSYDEIIAALRAGQTQITEGPFIDMRLYGPNGTSYSSIGEDFTAEGNAGKLDVRFLSSVEFGGLKNGCVFGGLKEDNREELLYTLPAGHSPHEHTATLDVDVSNYMYIRSECTTSKNKMCMTNPIWVNKT